MKKHLVISILLITVILLPLLPVSSSRADSLFDPKGVALFRDHRARMVGDVLTVVVVESTSAKNEGKSKFSKKVGMTGGVKIEGFLDYLFPGFFEPKEPLKALDIDPAEKFDGSGETTADNSFNTRMTATVKEVLPNGNLLIEGSRKVKVNEEDQEIVLTGVIRPEDITPSNTIASTNIADCEIFYRGKGPIGQRNKPGLLTKIFNWVF